MRASIEDYAAGESGERRFHAWELAEIARALDVSVSNIMIVLTDPDKAQAIVPGAAKKTS